jgi:hypothetical protein
MEALGMLLGTFSAKIRNFLIELLFGVLYPLSGDGLPWVSLAT